jgi:hypothetical protein
MYALGSIDEQKKKKKGRQLLVAAKMAPPLSNFLGTPLREVVRKPFEQIEEFRQTEANEGSQI